MKPLFDALKQLNVNVTFLEKENHLPVVIRGGNNKNLDVTLDAEMSSQFTSALLMSGANYESGLNIHLIG